MLNIASNVPNFLSANMCIGVTNVYHTFDVTFLLT